MAFEITVHDVGHGQAIHVVTEAGSLFVIDLGSKAGLSPLLKIQQSRRRIDRLLITHPHADHIGEIEMLKPLGLEPSVLIRPRHLSPEAIRSGNRPGDATKVEAYIELSDRYNVPLSPGAPWGSGTPDATTFEHFVPKGCASSNLNNHSVVAYIEHNGWGFMFPGDNEPPSWRELLEQEKFRQRLSTTQVFLPSHHARASGYCADLFEFLNPFLCVISDKECQDTDYSGAYGAKVSGNGLLVKHATGQIERRKTLTTRSDGTITFSIPVGSRELYIGATK